MKRSVLATVPLLLATGVATAGCTVLLDPGQQQCQTTSDCTARGFAGAVCTANVCEKVDPVWGCLGNVVEQVPDPTKTVTFVEQLTFTDQSPVTMATVDVCAKLDLECAQIDPNYPKGLTPGADGSVSLTVIQGFDGFIRITGPQIVDSRVFVGRPIVTAPSVNSSCPQRVPSAARCWHRRRRATPTFVAPIRAPAPRSCGSGCSTSPDAGRSTSRGSATRRRPRC